MNIGFTKNRSIIHAFTLILGVLFFSCNKNDKQSIEGNEDDCIKLPFHQVTLGKGADSTKVLTHSHWFWLKYACTQDSTFVYPSTDDLSEKITGSWFEFERVIGSNGIIINVSKNNTGSSRSVSLSVQCGNYYDYLNITQLGGD